MLHTTFKAPAVTSQPLPLPFPCSPPLRASGAKKQAKREQRQKVVKDDKRARKAGKELTGWKRMVVGGREPEQLSSLSWHWECSPLQGNSFYAALIIALCPPPPSMQETPCQQQEWGLAADHLPRGVGQPQLRAQVGNGVKAPCRCAPKTPALSMGQHRPCDPPTGRVGAHQTAQGRAVAQCWAWGRAASSR